jgi:imidazolonepropionase-like amidohydrolase
MSKPRASLFAVLAAFVIVAPASTAPRDSVTAFVNVRVVPMDSERVLADQTVVVRDGRIAEIGPSATVAVPEGARVVEGRGRYLLPGLIDMHVHIRTADLPAYVASGVTSVRNMWGYPSLLTTIERIERDELLGPTIYSASQGLDGRPPQWPATVIVDEPSQAEAAVEAQVAAGWRFIKVYQSLRPEVYDAIVAAARARGIRHVGHVATDVPIKRALASGQASIEHLSGYDRALSRRRGAGGVWAWVSVNGPKMGKLARRTREAGTWNCPTLEILDQLGRRSLSPDEAERGVANRGAMVKALRDRGARLLAGTDAGIDVTAPGTSLAEELRELVAAGLTPFEALAAATRDAAEFLGESAEIGTVVVGLRADLVLVSANPLEDVGAIATPEGVMLRGVWRPATVGQGRGARGAGDSVVGRIKG